MSFFPKKSVLVPVDFSDESLRAVDVALDLTDSPIELRIVHVLQDLQPLEAGEVWGVIDPQVRIEGAKKALKEKLSAAKYANVTTEVMLGDPATTIANYAQEIHAELIVLPSHGRTGLTRLLIGSVAERVVRLAHCPVLVLRT
jgi:nucleotide-binding universal stress UspA family protein